MAEEKTSDPSHIQPPSPTHHRPASTSSLTSSNPVEEIEKPEPVDPVTHPVGGGDTNTSTTDNQNAIKPTLSRSSSNTPELPFLKVLTIMIGVYLSVFLGALDGTIIGVAIPALSNQFHSFGDIGWYGSAYLMTRCAFQLVMGKVYQFYNVKWVFLSCIFLFELGSLIDAVSPNSVAFIWGRAIAGIGMAGIQNGGVAIMISVTPLRTRPAWMGAFGAVFGIASVLGPIIGGLFTTDVTWRWCFYINLPLGGVAITVVLLLLKADSFDRKPPTFLQQIKKLDPLGFCMFLPAIVCLLLALQWGGSTYNWGNARIIVLFIFSGLLFIGFVVDQVLQGENATVPVRVFKNRSISAGFWVALMVGAGFMTITYWLPVWFQAIKGVTAAHAGVMIIPLVLALIIASIGAGITVKKIGYYTPFIIAASILSTIGAGLFQLFTPHTDHPTWIGVQVLFAFGIGLGLQQPSLAAQAVLKKADVNVGVAVMFLAQGLGGAIFVSVAQNILNNQLAKGLSGIPGVNPKTFTTSGATEFQSQIPAQYREQGLDAYNNALVDVFAIAIATSGASLLGAVFMEWKSVKGPQKKKVDAEKGVLEKPAEGENEKA